MRNKLTSKELLQLIDYFSDIDEVHYITNMSRVRSWDKCWVIRLYSGHTGIATSLSDAMRQVINEVWLNLNKEQQERIYEICKLDKKSSD